MTTSTERPPERWSRTRLRVSAGRAGDPCRLRSATTVSDAGAPVVRPFLMSRGPAGVRASLVPEGALVLAGDGIELDVTVEAGASLELVEPGGTVAFDMRGGSASWQVRIDLGEGARLTWAGEPLVVAAGADLTRRTRVRVAPGARLALRETVVLGRYGEQPGRVLLGTDVADAAGPLLVEELELDRSSAPALLGGQRVLATVLCLGPDDPVGALDAPDSGAVDLDRYDLDRGGTLWRRLGVQAHRAALPDAWATAVRRTTASRAGAV